MPLSWLFSHTQAEDDSQERLSHLWCNQTEVIINHAGLRGFLPALPALLTASDVGLFKVNLPRESEREREGGLERRRTRRGGELSGSVALCSGSVSGGSITLQQWIPPACSGNVQDCSILWLTSPTHPPADMASQQDSGFFEISIKSLLKSWSSSEYLGAQSCGITARAGGMDPDLVCCSGTRALVLLSSFI